MLTSWVPIVAADRTLEYEYALTVQLTQRALGRSGPYDTAPSTCTQRHSTNGDIPDGRNTNFSRYIGFRRPLEWPALLARVSMGYFSVTTVCMVALLYRHDIKYFDAFIVFTTPVVAVGTCSTRSSCLFWPIYSCQKGASSCQRSPQQAGST